VVLSVVTQRSGSDANAGAVAAVASHAYDDLNVALAPLIGSVGMGALTARAAHLALAGYATWTQAEEREPAEPFRRVTAFLERQDPAIANQAAIATLSALGELLVTFIGEALTMRILRKAWPDGFSDMTSEDKQI
jgi:hypothetical protein